MTWFGAIPLALGARLGPTDASFDVVDPGVARKEHSGPASADRGRCIWLHQANFRMISVQAALATSLGRSDPVIAAPKLFNWEF